MSVTKVIMPKLGLTMDEGRLIAWHKAEGDRVTEGEVLFEVETDKAAMEVPATTSGFVRRLLAKPEDMVPVAMTVAIITSTSDEEFGDPAGAAPPLGRASSRPEDRSVLTPEPAEPARTARSSEPPRPADLVPGSSSLDRVATSPAARKLAQHLGVDLATVKPRSGSRITTEDVEAAAAAGPSAPISVGEVRIPLSRMRKAIAAAMSRSTREAPQFSIERDVDMTAANARRKQAGASYTDVVVSAAAKALAAHPRLRSRFDGDAIVEQPNAHVGLAVAVSDGLLVPVIRDADTKDLAALVREREHLEEGAHAGKLTADALSGAVFSVSNLGSLGVDRFTALVNPPEAAILAMGRVRDRVVARDGRAEVRPVVTLTLSVDHRVADGADAARFLDDVAKRLEAGE
ncbi:MAG TPA: dihydrolipoamide acetyltransferase family protein [Candidatus Limnocylindria bacterium]